MKETDAMNSKLPEPVFVVVVFVDHPDDGMDMTGVIGPFNTEIEAEAWVASKPIEDGVNYKIDSMLLPY